LFNSKETIFLIVSFFLKVKVEFKVRLHYNLQTQLHFAENQLYLQIFILNFLHIVIIFDERLEFPSLDIILFLATEEKS